MVAPGLAVCLPVAGQGVAAWRGLCTISRAVLAGLPPGQVDARGTPQLQGRGAGCHAGLQTQLSRLARPLASPSWWGPSPPGAGSTPARARSSSACPPGRRWGSAARRAGGVAPPLPSRPALRPPRGSPPATPACTWRADSSRRPAAARRRCARAHALGGTAPASAPAAPTTCSHWQKRQPECVSGGPGRPEPVLPATSLVFRLHWQDPVWGAVRLFGVSTGGEWDGSRDSHGTLGLRAAWVWVWGQPLPRTALSLVAAVA